MDIIHSMTNLHPMFSLDVMEPKDISELTAVVDSMSNLRHVFSMDDLDFISNIRPISSVNDQSTSYVLNGCNGA